MNSSYSGDAASGAAAAGILAFMGIWMLFVFAVLILVVAGLWKIFVKAGKPGWAAIVPIYNIYILIEIVGRPTWWLALLLLAFVPVIGSLAVMAAMFILYWDLAKSFGKDIGFAIGLTLLSPVFVPMLGFGSAQYIGPMASGFGLPDTPGGAAGGGYTTPGYVPPAQGYVPPAPTYTPPAPTYTPPTPPAPPAPPAAPSAPPAPPMQPPTPPQV